MISSSLDVSGPMWTNVAARTSSGGLTKLQVDLPDRVFAVRFQRA
jgi:hypothetical protein